MKQIKRTLGQSTKTQGLATKLKRNAKIEKEASLRLAKRERFLNQKDAGLLEVDDSLEKADGGDGYGAKTLKFRQCDILKHVDVGTRAKVVDLPLPFGDYYCSYTGNGRHVVLGGSKGHVSLLDTSNWNLLCERKVLF